MMRRQTEIVQKIILELTEKEARWLKSVVQNPLRGNPDEEPEEERDMRVKFWNALSDVE